MKANLLPHAPDFFDPDFYLFGFHFGEDFPEKKFPNLYNCKEYRQKQLNLKNIIA